MISNIIYHGNNKMHAQSNKTVEWLIDVDWDSLSLIADDAIIAGYPRWFTIGNNQLYN